MRRWLTLVGTAGVLACQKEEAPKAMPRTVSPARPDTVIVAESFITPFDTIDNVDSPAVYHDAERHWVLASAKTTDAVIVYDASTGTVIRRLGTSGTGRGQLRRPNGIAVVDSLLFVVERDNHRVQAFQLPSLRPVGSFGERELRKPYGIAGVRTGAGAWSVYITDNYEAPDESIPPDRELGARVRQFAVVLGAKGIAAHSVLAFGDTAGEGVLRTVESIIADSAQGLLLIAEETEVDSHIKVYDVAGKFTGRIFGRGRFPQQAEGIVLYACGDTAGYWIATDQGEQVNTFHVFDRMTLESRGSFTGRETRLTDGVALTQVPTDRFPSGALYASHLDGGVTAMAWTDIAGALGLRTDCLTSVK
ncbi:MAG: phytase [Cytophagaceae bacterium]|nr:phytase [Gemmatimonadaceae bacterium]